MEHLIRRDTFYLAKEYDNEVGTLMDYIDRLPDGRKKRTAIMLRKVCVLCRNGCGRIGFMTEAYRRVLRVKPVFKDFKYTIGSIYVYLKHYVIKDDSEEFAHIPWTIEVVTTARNLVQNLLSSITDNENTMTKYDDPKPEPLRDWLSEMIHYFDYAIYIADTFVLLDIKLQDCYSLCAQMKEVKFNFFRVNAQICTQTETSRLGPERKKLERRCEFYFEELQDTTTQFSKEILEMNEKQNLSSGTTIIEPNWDEESSMCYQIY
jgi:hypothetical protein